MRNFEELKEQYEGKIITSKEFDEILENRVSTDYAGKCGNGRMFLIYNYNSNKCFRVIIK